MTLQTIASLYYSALKRQQMNPQAESNPIVPNYKIGWIGTGCMGSATAQIAAEELGIDIHRMRLEGVDTDYSPDESYTFSSISIQQSGPPVRQAAAAARQFLLRRASTSLGVRAQIEGSIVQVSSWTVKEQVRSSESGIQSRDWSSYPILRFDEVPEVQVFLMRGDNEPALGVGETAQGPTAASIANAVFHTSGRRLRRLPFFSERFLNSKV